MTLLDMDAPSLSFHPSMRPWSLDPSLVPGNQTALSPSGQDTYIIPGGWNNNPQLADLQLQARASLQMNPKRPRHAHPSQLSASPAKATAVVIDLDSDEDADEHKDPSEHAKHEGKHSDKADAIEPPQDLSLESALAGALEDIAGEGSESLPSSNADDAKEEQPTRADTCGENSSAGRPITMSHIVYGVYGGKGKMSKEEIDAALAQIGHGFNS